MFRKALIGCAALLWAGSAQAATIVQSISYSNRGGPSYGSMFDPALGNLFSVQMDMSLSTNIGGSIRLLNLEDHPIDVTFYWDGGFTAVFNDGDDIFNPFDGNVLGSASFEIHNQQTVTLAPGEFGGTIGGKAHVTNYFDPALFIGPGQLRFAVGAEGQPSYTATEPLFEYSSDDIHLDVYVGGTLTYTYFSAPEPATWLMMIAGFGLVGGALRRRRVGALAWSCHPAIAEV